MLISKLILTAVFFLLLLFLSNVVDVFFVIAFFFRSLDVTKGKYTKIMVGCDRIARSVYHIQPIWSKSHGEARTRVIKLYKTWFREVPQIGNIRFEKLNSFIQFNILDFHSHFSF